MGPVCASQSDATRHVDRHTVNEIRIAGSEKTDNLGLIGGLSNTTQRREFDLGGLRLGAALVLVRPDALGQSEARCDGVHCDAVRPELGA